VSDTTHTYAVMLTRSGGLTRELCRRLGEGLEGTRTTCYVSSGLVGGRYTIWFRDVTAGHSVPRGAAFTVPIYPQVWNQRLSLTLLYPIVQDRYRDAATLSFSTNRAALVAARVTDCAGRVVRSVSLGWRGPGTHAWTWRGRNNAGGAVAPGTYCLHGRATAAGRTARGPGLEVRVRTGYVVNRVTKVRLGDEYTSGVRTSLCYAYTSWFRWYDLYLDCWGGAYVQARWAFAIPANAFNVTWSVSGRRYCCADGTVSRWAYRGRYYNVYVKVTRWASYDVHSVRVSYSTRRRI
jgi:hypothetical protein